LRAAYALKPDAIVLDADTSHASRELFHILNQVSQVPTIVTGEGSSDELVFYLEAGAAAYLPRPVSPTLLTARLSSLFRRANHVEAPSLVNTGSLTIDLTRCRVQRNG